MINALLSHMYIHDIYMDVKVLQYMLQIYTTSSEQEESIEQRSA